MANAEKVSKFFDKSKAFYAENGTAEICTTLGQKEVFEV